MRFLEFCLKPPLVVAYVLLMLSIGIFAQDQSANSLSPVSKFSITGYPYYGAVVTPNDSADLGSPGFVRADAAGAVRARCFGNGTDDETEITLNLQAGEFFPCLAERVYDTGTDAITLHVFY